MTDRELLEAMKDVITPLHTQLRAMQAELGDLKDAMQAELGDLKDAITMTNMRIENQIIPDIQKLAEGHELILERIDEKIEDRTEALQAQIDVLNSTVRQHSQDIRELKKAQ